MRQVYDSDGRRYRQLVKSGQDDMRQDAVMQQFFQLVNVLLATDPATRKRQLHIVTYKVEPWPEPPVCMWLTNMAMEGQQLQRRREG